MKTNTHSRYSIIPLALLHFGMVLLPLNTSAVTVDAPNEKYGAVISKPVPVRVNRTLPKVSPPSEITSLSASPSESEIFKARVFNEPLVPIGKTPSIKENEAFAKALNAFLVRLESDDFLALEEFLFKHPKSPWCASLLANLGTSYYGAGYFSKALSAWETAWRLLRAENGPMGKAVGDEVAGELMKMNARLGRKDRLDSLFAELNGRQFMGPATEKVAGAREGLWVMKNDPGKAFLCGPKALQNVMRQYGTLSASQETAFFNIRSGMNGFSLWQVDSLAKAFNLKMEMVHREGTEEPILPVIVHWKVGHFASILRKQGGRYLMKDPTFGEELWLTRKALFEEASGYFLVPAGNSPKGWKPVDPKEANGIFGKGFTTQNDPVATKPNDQKIKNDTKCQGMAAYDIHAMVVSLNITDIPVGYSPPKGPPVKFLVTYNQRDATQPAIFTYSNLGPKWSFDWLSYVTDLPASPSSPATVYLRGGGSENFSDFNSSTSSYVPDIQSRAQLVRVGVSPIKYERRMPDGYKEIFSVSSGGTPRKIFMSAIVDPAGNQVTLTYDASLRVVAVSDALGQVTLLEYGIPADPLKVTKVADPFGRFATFEYDASKRLSKITDVIGMSSQFTYAGDFVKTMTTPYGTTSFSFGEDGTARWLEVRNPLGGTERAEFRNDAKMDYVNEGPVPKGLVTTAIYNQYRNTFFWDDRTFGEFGRDFTKARLYHWAHSNNLGATGTLLESIKDPLEGRVYFNYPNESNPAFMTNNTIGLPSKVGRVLDDGTTQLYSYEYNANGLVTKSTDPLGRTSIFQYAANNLDLISMRQMNGATSDLLSSISYNGQRLLESETNAAGQTTAYTYNAAGQLSTITNPKNEIVTFNYLPDGYLKEIVGNASGNKVQFEYDPYARVSKVTTPDGSAVLLAYDALDRLIKRTYPDGTYDQFVYEKLDVEKTRDRAGRWSRTLHNALRQPTLYQDPLGKITTMSWCHCGDVESVTDSQGRTTKWRRDLQRRLISKEYPDGRRIKYSYENTSSRLKSITDAMGQITEFEYFSDNSLKKLGFQNAVHATPSVTYVYDNVYPRLKQVTDGIGVTSFEYGPVSVPPTLDAGQVTKIDGPLSNDDVTFSFDELGRITTRSLDGNATTVSYDGFGRIQSMNDLLGTFNFTYDGSSSRLTNVSYPNGQRAQYGYQGFAQDFRLEEIENTGPGASAISKFGYSYDSHGRIKTSSLSKDGLAANTFAYKYDGMGQLVSAVLRSGSSGGNILKQFGFAYDPAGNRTSAQIDNFVGSSTANDLNQIISSQAGGKMRFEGTVNEPSTVKVNGRTASNRDGNGFSGSAPVVPGSNRVEVQAKDRSNNFATQAYSVSVQGAPAASFTYDANGNMLSDGVQSYEWDAINRMISVQKGVQRSEFAYDGFGRIAAVTEKNGATLLDQKRFVWAEYEMVQERDGDGLVVRKNFLSYGTAIDADKYFYTFDHQGSVREVLDVAGNLQARYDYTPFGERTTVFGGFNSDKGYTGQYRHQPSGLLLFTFRAYSPALGRWLSQDPIGFSGGDHNLYRYVLNNPINLIDPFGLYSWDEFGNHVGQFAVGFGDAASLGATKWIRGMDFYGGDDFTNPCSGAYTSGVVTGIAAGIAISGGGGAAVKGVGTAAERLAVNKAAGAAAERLVAKQLVAEGSTILGSQVTVRTSEGLRRIDHLIQTSEGTILAIEVKAGNAVRTAQQLARDALMGTEGAIIVGKNAPAEMQGLMKVIQTVERIVK